MLSSGTYTVTLTDANGCLSNHLLLLRYFEPNQLIVNYMQLVLLAMDLQMDK